MLLLRNSFFKPMEKMTPLATARHVAALASKVYVPACTAVELVPLVIGDGASRTVKEIAAIPAVEDVLALASGELRILAVSPVDDVIALVATERSVVARPAVDDVVAGSSGDEVSSAKAAHLVLAIPTVQKVWFVGAGEQAALGAAG